MADGFLNRWSQRKQDVREGKPLAEPTPPTPALAPAPATTVNAGSPLVGPVAASSAAAELEQPAPPALPTLVDAQQLTPESDFKPFMVRGVAADVKNAAMKKLFTDPHFNVMDRLDTYIDDYSISDPIPEAMLRKMVSAKFLNLFDEEKEAEVEPASDLPGGVSDVPDTDVPQTVAQSPLPLEAPEKNDDDTDLRLQPDHAPEREGVGRGTA